MGLGGGGEDGREEEEEDKRGEGAQEVKETSIRALLHYTVDAVSICQFRLQLNWGEQCTPPPSPVYTLSI